ncbi:MAG: hypothetical protein K0S44_444 [Bacteroidetes bacterium]|jgi:hypothetical protein|nr:hypothetical protein [Bacteroidota bacterium]
MKKLYFYIQFILLFNITVLYSQPLTFTSNPTVFSVETTTGLSWNNEINLNSSDDQRARSGMWIGLIFTINTDVLNTQGYGFSIPSSAVITGIEVKLEKRAQGIGIGSSIRDNTLQLLKNSGPVGNTKSNSAAWSASDITEIYGGPTDLWGTTWEPSEINSPGFGCAFSAKLSAGTPGVFMEAELDEAQIKVYYTLTPLEISLVYFDAFIMEDQKVKLKWMTESETNNDHFVLQHSKDAIAWSDKATIPGAGNSTSPVNYECIDDETVEGLSYYRLKQIDFDGFTSYHKVTSVEIQPGKTNVSFGPNPTKDRIIFKCSKPMDTSLIIYLYDINWNQVKQTEKMFLKKNESNSIELNIPELKNGIYFYKAVMEEDVVSGQLVKED